MVQTCLFDESWAGAGRRRPRSDEAPGECATGVTAELEQLKKSQSGELEQLEARLQSAHSEELEQLKVGAKFRWSSSRFTCMYHIAG